jgi:hypothetical protein
MTPRWAAFWFIAAVAALIADCQAKAQSGEHGDGHAEMHSAYEHWKDRNGYGCCDDRDCRPVRANVVGDGRWSVWIDGRWLPVPPDAVLRIPSPDGRSHVCMAPGAVEPRCFVPGEPRS